MRLYEHEAKRLLAGEGIAIPQGVVVGDVAGAVQAAASLGPPVVLKAQVLASGRRERGEVKVTRALDQVSDLASALFPSTSSGAAPNSILVESWIEVEQEYYLALTYDPLARLPVALASLRGGTGVEQALAESPTHLARETLPVLHPVPDFLWRQIVASLGVGGRELLELSRILSRLGKLFFQHDLTLAEINPLARVSGGQLVALDAHIEIDDDALYRQQDLLHLYGIDPARGEGCPLTLFEQEAAAIDAMDHRGVAGRVVEFQGSLGLLIGGGGASLTIFDAVRRHGGKPANYCEVGGNPSVRKVAALTQHLLRKPGVERIAVIMNVVNNTRADLMARGVIKGVLAAGYKPVEKIAIFRVPGAWEEEAQKILQRYGVPFVERSVSIDEAAQLAVARAGQP